MARRHSGSCAKERAPTIRRMSGYAFHPDAFADLDEIWDYIAADNVDAADRVRSRERERAHRDEEWAQRLYSFHAGRSRSHVPSAASDAQMISSSLRA